MDHADPGLTIPGIGGQVVGGGAPNVPPVPARSDRPSTSSGFGQGQPFGLGGMTNNAFPMTGGMGGMGYGFGGFGASPYGSSMYGGGMGMYSRFDPMNQNMQPQFGPMAEESVRPAFESLYGVVQAVGSISMMIESSFMAVYSSFQAVVGVADHFVRMRNQLVALITSITLIRWLTIPTIVLIVKFYGKVWTKVQWTKWFWMKLRLMHRLTYLLGITDAPVVSSDALVDPSIELGGQRRASSWPLLLFLGVVFAGPLLVWRLLRNASSANARNRRAVSDWSARDGEFYTAHALFDFAASADDELPLRAGQEITVAPKRAQTGVRGWLLAADTQVSQNGKRRMGLVPANYVKITARHQQGDVTVAPPLVPRPQLPVPSSSDLGSVPTVASQSLMESPPVQSAEQTTVVEAQQPHATQIQQTAAAATTVVNILPPSAAKATPNDTPITPSQLPPVHTQTHVAHHWPPQSPTVSSVVSRSDLTKPAPESPSCPQSQPTNDLSSRTGSLDQSVAP